MKNKIKNIFYIFFPLLIGTIVGLIIKNNIDYSNLVKPPLAPPKILFPIAWTIIYLLMGISYYLLNKEKISSKEKIIYYIQLFINAMWSILFFLLKWRLFSCFWIILLNLIVLIMIIIFYNKNKTSAYLNIPYFIWIIFATYLTLGIYILN